MKLKTMFFTTFFVTASLILVAAPVHAEMTHAKPLSVIQTMCSSLLSKGFALFTPKDPADRFINFLRNPPSELKTGSGASSSDRKKLIFAYMHEAIALSPTSRLRVLAVLNESPILGSDRIKLALALYDMNAWVNYYPQISYLALNPNKTFLGTQSYPDIWREVFQHIPDDLKVQLDAMVSKNYRNASKSPKSATTFTLDRDAAKLMVGEKRGIDAYLRLEGVSLEAFHNGLKNGGSVKASYLSALAAQKAKYFSDSEVGDCDGELIFDVAHAVQAALNQVGDLNNDTYVMFGGSVVNGKGVIGTSDVDMSQFEDERPILNIPLLSQIKENLEKVFSQYGISKFEVEIPPGEPSPITYVKLNPFQFKISRAKIELLVYPTPIAGKAAMEVEHYFIPNRI